MKDDYTTYNNDEIFYQFVLGQTPAVNYIIDMRTRTNDDELLNRLCQMTGGEYIRYTPENLNKLIRHINEKREQVFT